MKLFDAHCHLPEGDFESAMARAAAAGVVGLAICGTNSNDWNRVCKLAEKFPMIGKRRRDDLIAFPMLGIHPWFVSNDWKNDFQTLEAYCIGTHKTFQPLETGVPVPAVGIGECGLDFQERFKNRAEQEECFVAHLELAERLNRPVAVHCVQAWGRLLEILRRHPAPKKILHAFSGSAELVPELAKLNCWFSFCGNVTNPNAKRVHAAVAAVPEDRLLIETDAPDFPPAGCAAPNESANLICVAQAVADLRSVSVDAVADLTFNNAENIWN